MTSLQQTWGEGRLAATLYDLGVHSRLPGRVAARVLWGFDIDLLWQSVARLREAPAGTRVLDVPCGGGLAFAGLAPGHGLDYTALDYSPVMLARARARLARLGAGGVRFLQGDVGALPQADASIDLCLSYNGIHCFPDPALAVREMARVLRPGGLLRATLVVQGAGARHDAVVRLFRARGWFGPGCTQPALLRWLADAGLQADVLQRSGAILLVEARKAG